MNTEHKDLDENALAARLNRSWGQFKQGKIISYKLMAVLLILIATIGCTWYILSERNKVHSQRWLTLEEANTISALEEVAKNNPNTIQERIARLEIARYQLGISGIDQLGATNIEQRKKAIDNIEKARESFGKLLPEFKDDPVFKTECLLALAKAEAALVPVPVKDGSLTEFKGSIPKVVEWLDQLATTAAPDTPWATESKKLADSLRDPNSQNAHEFVHIEQVLFRPPFSDFGTGTSPILPGFPNQPGLPGDSFKKIEPTIPGVPAGPAAPSTAPGTSSTTKGPDAAAPGPVAPLPPSTAGKSPEPAKVNEPGAPIAPGPKAPEAKSPPVPTSPTSPEAKGPTPPPQAAEKK
jgi:hypothetical protein